MSSVDCPPSRRVTMRDIARELQISHVTVSLALSDNPRIPLTRRRQVKEHAQRLGYRPDPALTALINHRLDRRSRPEVHAALAWLNLWPDPARLRAYREFDGYWRGACEVAEAHGYRLEEFHVSDQLPLKRIESILRARNVPGVLLPPSYQRGQITPADLDWSRFSVVCFGHSHSQMPVHMVTADQAAAGRIALQSVRSRGYRRIGYVTKAGAMVNMMFSAGLLQSQASLPAHERVPVLVLDDALNASQFDLLAAWLRTHQPDALITDLPETREWLATLGLRVPQDLGLAALSCLDGNADAGIDQNPVEIGRVAAETLISLINHHHRGIPAFQRHILVEGFWRDGSTLPVRE